MNESLEQKIALLPEHPGVYKMFDAGGEVIYVGKAINLKNRVRQYFRSQNGMQPKVVAMVSHIADFEYILTASEAEAFALESNLIKQFKPRYNILLKDDKHFPYIRVDMRQDFPAFTVVRRIKNDGATYFGPYISGLGLKESMSVIRDHFPIRHCKKDIKRAIAANERPCLMYHIGKCCAPCSGSVTREEYHRMVDEIAAFLRGDTENVISELTEKMNLAAESLDFERALRLRDSIKAIKSLSEKQQAISVKDAELDVFAVCRDEAEAMVFALFIRGGKVIGTEHFALSDCDISDGALMTTFLRQYYNENVSIPPEAVLNTTPDELGPLEEYLSALRGRKVHITVPKRGEKLGYTQMAYENGVDTLKKRRELKKREWERGEGALAQLCTYIGLDELPRRIECFDNSHIMGRDTVGGMVVFTDGSPDRPEYRRFRIKTQTEGDDYAAMHEVLTRRFKRAAEKDGKFAQLPDLIVVDGGRGQLNAALRVLDDFSLTHIPAIGLAERNEDIILKESPEPLSLPKNSPALHFLERIRDEAHRFAISYHRSLRQKNALYSVLSSIDGIGEKRRRALFSAFVTLDRIRAATVDELAAADTMNRAAAQSVYDYFHKRKEKNDEV